MVTKTRRIDTTESSPDDTGPLRWSVERRLAFIEERLFWLGAVNRTDLVRRFGVSMSQASVDIARYLAHAPRDVRYDKSAKRYVAGERFKPVLAEPDAARLLGELRLVNAGIMAVDEALLGAPPPFDVAPVPERRIDPLVLRAVLRAIRQSEAIDAAYQSMSRPEPVRRTIEPHALAHDGFRWHARAFDRTSGEFRDFVLGRLSVPRPAGSAATRSQADEDWQARARLVIAPHPELTPVQSRAIAIDYGIHGRSTVIEVRRALLFYALRRLGLDASAAARPPAEQHIVLLNRAEIEAMLPRRAET